MRTLVANSAVIALLLTGSASLSAAGETQSTALPSRHAASQAPAAHTAKRSTGKKVATNHGRLADLRTPQQVGLTIHFQ